MKEELSEITEELLGKAKVVMGGMLKGTATKQEFQTVQDGIQKLGKTIEKMIIPEDRADEIKKLNDMVTGFNTALSNVATQVDGLEKQGGARQSGSGMGYIAAAVKHHLTSQRGFRTEKYSDSTGDEHERIMIPTGKLGEGVKGGSYIYPKDVGMKVKAGEEMFLQGTPGQQNVFEQAVNMDRNIQDVNIPPAHPFNAFDLMIVGKATGSEIHPVVWNNYEPNVDFVDEGQKAAARSRIEKTSKMIKVVEITADADFSRAEMQDNPDIFEVLQKRLIEDAIIKIDGAIFSSGGDNSTICWGAFNSENSTPFNALVYDGQDPNPTNAHVFRRMRQYTQFFASEYGASRGFTPNVAIMSHATKSDIEGLENTDTDSRNLRWLTYDKDTGLLNVVSGMLAAQNPQVGDNEGLVMVNSLQEIRMRQGIGFESGYVGDGLKTGIFSIVMTARFAYTALDPTAHVYESDLASAIAIQGASPATSLTRIDGYAVGSDAAALTIQTMINAGGLDTIVAELLNYKAAVAAAANVLTVPALQAIIDAVNP